MERSKNPFADIDDNEYKINDIRIAKAHDKRKFKKKRLGE